MDALVQGDGERMPPCMVPKMLTTMQIMCMWRGCGRAPRELRVLAPRRGPRGEERGAVGALSEVPVFALRHVLAALQAALATLLDRRGARRQSKAQARGRLRLLYAQAHACARLS